jgi:hypothetical protein
MYTPEQLINELKQGNKIKIINNEQVTDYCDNYWFTEVYGYNKIDNTYTIDYIEADLHIENYKEDEVFYFLRDFCRSDDIKSIEIINNASDIVKDNYYLYFIKNEGYKLYGSGDMTYIMELLNDYLKNNRMYNKESVEFKVTTKRITN